MRIYSENLNRKKENRMQNNIPKKLFQVLTIGIFCITLDGGKNPSRALPCKDLMAKCISEEQNYPGWHAGCESYPDIFAVKSCRKAENEGGDNKRNGRQDSFRG